MNNRFGECKICGSRHTSIANLWAHFRNVHKTQATPKHARTYNIPPNVHVDLQTEVSQPEADGYSDRGESHDDEDNLSFCQTYDHPRRFNQQDVTWKVARFFESLNQHCTALIVDDEEPCPSITDLPYEVQLVVRFCLDNMLSKAMTRKLYDLFAHFDEDCGGQRPSFSEHFSSVNGFVEYISRQRRMKLHRQGWKRCHIHLMSGAVNRTGCFRSPLELAIQVVKGAGGV